MMKSHTNSDTPVSQAMDLDAVLRRYLANPTASWGLGTFGAVAEFHRTAAEPASIDTGATLQVVTARGALQIHSTQGLRAFAYEQPGGALDSWHHVLTLCLPADRTTMNRRSVLTECGPDDKALRPEDREATLFDMGLDTEQVDVCVRTADPKGLAQLRTGLGRPLFAPGNSSLIQVLPQLSPHRVFICRFARLEVYQRIPGPNETPPEGPHTHVLPDILRHQRSHPATMPIPEGWVPCLSLYPASPVQDALGQPRPFDHGAYEDFQGLLRAFGDPELYSLKQVVAEAVRADTAPERFPVPESRAGRAAVRIALRQLQHTDGDRPVLDAWCQAFDRKEAAA